MSKKIIAFNGSPVKGGNTDILTQSILKGAGDAGYGIEHVYLNDLEILPCQSCGESPGDKLCFFEDDLFPYLHKFAGCDIAVVSSPVYFDTVSAQTKLFIDRCNCFKPLEGYETGKFQFQKLYLKPHLGIIALVGGEREKFVHALTVIKGFFIWTGVQFFDQILFAHPDYGIGEVWEESDILESARKIGYDAARRASKK
jgi:multimeric flavodoxin WrbA